MTDVTISEATLRLEDQAEELNLELMEWQLLKEALKEHSIVQVWLNKELKNLETDTMEKLLKTREENDLFKGKILAARFLRNRFKEIFSKAQEESDDV